MADSLNCPHPKLTFIFLQIALANALVFTIKSIAIAESANLSARVFLLDVIAFLGWAGGGSDGNCGYDKD